MRKVVIVSKISRQALEHLNSLGFVVIIRGGN